MSTPGRAGAVDGNDLDSKHLGERRMIGGKVTKHVISEKSAKLAVGLLAFCVVVIAATSVSAEQLIIIRSGNLPPERSTDPDFVVAGEPCVTPADCPPLEQFLIDACQAPTCESGVCGFESACSEIESCDGDANCYQTVFPCTTPEDCEALDPILIDSCWVRTCESGFCGSGQACSELELCDGVSNCYQVIFPCVTAADCPPLDQSLIDRCHEPTCENLLCDSADACSEIEVCDGAASCVQVVFFDERLTYLPGPELAPFPAAFTPEDFDDARAGPAPALGFLSTEGCAIPLQDALAKSVETGVPELGRPATSALFAIDFDITEPAILTASLDLYIGANDTLGGGPNQGVYLNGVAISGDSSGGDCDSAEALHIYREDIAGLLRVGTNTVYFNVTHTDEISSLKFTGTIRISADEADIIHVDDDAAPGGDGLSWGSAYNNLQDGLTHAIASSSPVREIWVAEGIYIPTELLDVADSRTAIFQTVPGVTIYGGFLGSEATRDQRRPDLYTTELSGDLAGNDFLTPTNPTWSENAYNVVRAGSDHRERPGLDGITITHGNATGAYNTSQTRGGGVYAPDDTILKGCKIIANGGRQGAGLYSGVETKLIDCDVSDNFGAGIYGATEANITLTSCRLERNIGQNLGIDGGGVLLLGTLNPSLTGTIFTAIDTVFRENSTPGRGGVFYSPFRCNINLYNCDFIGNSTTTSNGRGGVAYLASDSVLNVTGCTFDGNTTEGREGCFYLDHAIASFDNCTFLNNSGRWSTSGIYASNTALEVRNSTFHDNAGLSYSVIQFFGPSEFTLENSLFESNQSGSSGCAVDIWGGASCEITNSIFRNNTARGLGGAVHIRGSAPSSFAFVDFINCEFVGNATRGTNEPWGGAVAVDTSIVSFVNCAIVHNHAVISGVYAENSLVTIKNSIVRGNTDDVGTGLDVQFSGDGASLFTVTDSNVQDIGPGNRNIDADPLFAELPNDGGDGWFDDNNTFGDLHVLPGSPCIDAGSNSALPEAVVDDLDGNPRFHDDPTTVDTGIGVSPIVDMGAFEFRPGDCDDNGTVNLFDLVELAPCMSGPAPSASAACSCFDLTNDGRVDLRDAAVFQTLFNQP